MISNEVFFQYYNFLFFLGSYFALLFAFILDIKPANRWNLEFDKWASLFFVFPFMLLVGLRDFNVGTDTGNYLFSWLNEDTFELRSDFLFNILMYVVRSLIGSYQAFLLIVSALYFGIIYFVFRTWCKAKQQSLFLLLFSFLALFFSLSTSINVIRQGLSLVFVLLAYIYFLRNNKKAVFISYAIALSLHLTAIIPLLLWFFILFFKKIKLSFFMVLYFLGIAISFLGVGINNLFPFMGDLLNSIGDRRISYLEDGEAVEYIIGFKPQFVAFNTIFLLVFLFIYKKLDNSRQYEDLLKYYLLSSFIFFMAFQLAFSDRWGLFGWFFIPFLLSPLFSFRTKEVLNFKLVTVIFLIFVFLFFNVFLK